MPAKVPASAPVRVEIRIGGRIRFAGPVYDPALTQDESTVSLTGDLQPTMVTPPKEKPPVRFGDDPRDGEEIIQRVHSGRRDVTENKGDSEAKKSPKPS